MAQGHRIYRPAEAAERLGISAPGLRRIVKAYEAVHGALPRDERQARVWPEEALERLSAARALVHSHQAATIESALQAMQEGLGPGEAVALPPNVPRSDLATRDDLADVVRVLMEENAAIRAELARMRDLLEHVAGELPAPPKRPWWRLWGR